MTCSDWDFRTMFLAQMKLSKLSIPGIFKHWININFLYEKTFEKNIRGMTDLLYELDIKLEGRHHSGIDDTRNISKCLIKMLQLKNQ